MSQRTASRCWFSIAGDDWRRRIWNPAGSARHTWQRLCWKHIAPTASPSDTDIPHLRCAYVVTPNPSANSFGTSPCCLGSAHHSVMPSLASTNSFSRTSFVKQCPYRNPRHTTFGCRPAFSRFAPCDRAIRRPKLALPKASPSQSSPRIVARITLRVRRLSPPTLVALRSVPTAQQSPSFRHDRFVAEDLRLYLSLSRIISFAERISVVKEQILASRCHPLCWGRPSSVGVRATSDERNTNG